jgi:hypothetical protein
MGTTVHAARKASIHSILSCCDSARQKKGCLRGWNIPEERCEQKKKQKTKNPTKNKTKKINT